MSPERQATLPRLISWPGPTRHTKQHHSSWLRTSRNLCGSAVSPCMRRKPVARPKRVAPRRRPGRSPATPANPTGSQRLRLTRLDAPETSPRSGEHPRPRPAGRPSFGHRTTHLAPRPLQRVGKTRSALGRSTEPVRTAVEGSAGTDRRAAQQRPVRLHVRTAARPVAPPGPAYDGSRQRHLPSAHGRADATRGPGTRTARRLHRGRTSQSLAWVASRSGSCVAGTPAACSSFTTASTSWWTGRTTRTPRQARSSGGAVTSRGFSCRDATVRAGVRRADASSRALGRGVAAFLVVVPSADDRPGDAARE